MANKCEKCPAFWSNYSSYIGDGDCGCLIRDIEKHEYNCRLPYFIRAIRARLWEWSTNRFWKKRGKESDRELKNLGGMK